jgi:D-threo-aldose 1-dehydrogenase
LEDIMNAREAVRLGRSRTPLTRLSFGGAPIGNFAVDVTDADAEAALGAAWDAGIRYFDTAPWYGLGLSEHRVGAFLRSKRREEFTLSTKVGRILKPWGRQKGPRINRGPWIEPLDFEVRFDYSYDGVIRAYEDSLQRLGLADVDILLIHDLDRGYHQSEVAYSAARSQLVGGLQALRDLRADGRIKAFGAGVNNPGVIPDFRELYDLELFLVAGPYTLLEQPILETELVDFAERGIDIVVGAAFAYGILATGVAGYREDGPVRFTPEQLRRVARLEELCVTHGVPLPAAALQFATGHPAVRSVLFGAVDPAQVRQSVANFEHPIPDEFWTDLKAESLLPAATPVPGGGN